MSDRNIKIMQAYPIRGIITGQTMVLRGTLDETEILTRGLEFKKISEVSFGNAYVGTVSQINGGYCIADITVNPRLYLSFLNGHLITSTNAYPFNLQSSSVSNLWYNVVAGALYSLEDTTWRLRFLPTKLYVGGTTSVIEGQQVIDLEKTITSYINPPTYYFTNTVDAKDNILYKYSYGSYCDTLSKGYCPYVTNYEFEMGTGSSASCHLAEPLTANALMGSPGFTCGDSSIKEMHKERNATRIILLIALVTFLLAFLAFCIGALIITTRTSQVYRPELYFDDAVVTDIDQYH